AGRAHARCELPQEEMRKLSGAGAQFENAQRAFHRQELAPAMAQAVAQEGKDDAGVDLRGEGIVGDVGRDLVFGPGLEPSLHVELALALPDQRLGEGNVAFQRRRTMTGSILLIAASRFIRGWNSRHPGFLKPCQSFYPRLQHEV